MKKRLFAALLVTALLLSLVPAVSAADRTEGTITIHKFDNTGDDAGDVGTGDKIDTDATDLGQPMDGVTFRVSQIKEDPLVTSSYTAAQAQSFVTANAALYASNALYQETVSTGSGSNATGVAKFPSTGTGLPFGIYLVEEIAGSGSTKAVEPFLVYLPLTLVGETDSDPDKLLYDVHVYPKNEPLYINKDGNATAANVGDTVTWTIDVGIPADVATMNLTTGYYIVRDDLDARLNFVSASVATSGGTALTAVTDYALTDPSAASGYEGGGRVDVSVNTAAGVGILSAAQAAGESLKVTIVTEINTKALINSDPSSSTYPLPEPIENTATLLYKNSGGDPGNPDPGIEPPDPPEVEISGLTVVKVDGEDGALLDGAVFDLYWCALTELDPTDPDVYQKVASGTTNLSGYIYWKFDDTAFDHTKGDNTSGIGYGHYFVRETKAPAGYQLQTSISQMVKLENGDTEGHTWRLGNYKLGGDFELPTTGGSGTVLYTVAGVGLIVLGAGLFLLAGRRRRQRR